MRRRLHFGGIFIDRVKRANLLVDRPTCQASGIRENLALRSAAAVVWALLLSFLMSGFSSKRAEAEGLKPRVIVFVHGLHGDRDTWRASNGAYWPQMVQSDPHFQQDRKSVV